MSAVPPGGKGTTMVIGRLGKSEGCAQLKACGPSASTVQSRESHLKTVNFEANIRPPKVEKQINKLIKVWILRFHTDARKGVSPKC
jgi:hypothetical protein